MLHMLPMNPDARNHFLEGHATGITERKTGNKDKRCEAMATLGYPYWHGYKAGFNLPLGLTEEAVRLAAAADLKDYVRLAMRTDDILKHGKNWKLTPEEIDNL